MNLHDKLCFTAIMVGWAILMSFIFFGCATTVHPDKPKPVVEQAKWQDSPWSWTIARNFHLVWCDDARKKIIELGERREQLIHLRDSKLGSAEFRQSLQPKIDAIPYWILQIDYWMKDNCPEA